MATSIIQNNQYTAGTGINITNNSISNVFAQLSSINLDDVQYNYQGYIYNATNRPSGTTNNGLLMSFFRDVADYRGIQLYADVYYTGTTRGNIWSRVYNTTWSSWRQLSDCYMAGDTLTLNSFINVSGMAVNNTQLRFLIPLEKPINASSVSASLLSITLYYNGTRYINNKDVVSDSNYSLNTYLRNNGIEIYLTSNSSIFTQYSVVGVGINSATFTFS